MSAGGSISHMVVTLRNNRNLRRKRSYLNQPYYSKIRREYQIAAGGSLGSKRISKEEMSLIRKKVLNKRRKDKLKIQIISIILSIAIISFGFYINNEAEKDRIIRKANLRIEQIEINKSNYLSFIKTGDNYLKQQKWDYALVSYHRAFTLFPKRFDARYRLALAYAYRCQNKRVYCDKGKKVYNQLILEFPDNKELLKLEEYYVLDTLLKD